jgi:hypothetical protein
MRKVPRCMSTQHPDNINTPFFSDSDVLAGERSGTQTALILRKERGRPLQRGKMKTVKADFTLDGLREFATLVLPL